MKRFSGNAGLKQRGDMLLEALVGMVLLSVLGLGLTYATSRVLVQQRYANTQNLALSQMRHLLETDGVDKLCADGAVAVKLEAQGGSFSFTGSVRCYRSDVTVIPGTGLPAISGDLNSVVTTMRFATPANDAQAEKLLGPGSLVIQQ